MDKMTKSIADLMGIEQGMVQKNQTAYEKENQAPPSVRNKKHRVLVVKKEKRDWNGVIDHVLHITFLQKQYKILGMKFWITIETEREYSWCAPQKYKWETEYYCNIYNR